MKIVLSAISALVLGTDVDNQCLSAAALLVEWR